MGKKITEIQNTRAVFEDYFKEDLAAIEEELEKSKDYSRIIDSEIQKLNGPSLGVNKGSQHYLIEHINNAVALQTQRQGLRKDRFNIKKTIMDYAAKFADSEESGESASIEELINKLISKDRTSETLIQDSSSEDLDSAIDNILGDE